MVVQCATILQLANAIVIERRIFRGQEALTRHQFFPADEIGRGDVKCAQTSVVGRMSSRVLDLR